MANEANLIFHLTDLLSTDKHSKLQKGNQYLL